jgi:hypothetical protein
VHWGTAVLIVVVLLGVLPSLTFWAGALVMRMPVRRVNFFVGPQILTFGSDAAFAIRLLPIGGSIELIEDGLPDTYPFRHPVLRAATWLVPLGYHTLLATTLLGWERTWEALLTGWSQAFWGTISSSEAQLLIAGFLRLPVAEAIGVFAAKNVSVSLIPLPCLPLARACLEIAAWKRGLDVNTAPLLHLIVVSAVILAACLFQWVRAFITVLFWGVS